MTRAGWLFVGAVLILVSLVLLWLGSPAGAEITPALIRVAGLPPETAQALFTFLFMFGFVMAAGGIGEAQSIAGKLLFGFFLYFLIAVLFGSYVLLVSPGGGRFSDLASPFFLRFALSWPYHTAASLGLFGLIPRFG